MLVKLPLTLPIHSRRISFHDSQIINIEEQNNFTLVKELVCKKDNRLYLYIIYTCCKVGWQSLIQTIWPWEA